jgi:opacity protein-like surface antigen
MKKTLTIAVLVLLALSSAALADTLQVTSETALDGSTQSSSLGPVTVAVKGNLTFTFQVAGKSCTLKTSANGSVPTGCNYAVTVAPNGSISGTLTAGNQFCTQSNQIASSCK